MSTCVHCGECCRIMSPIEVDPEHTPCRYLKVNYRRLKATACS